MLFLFGFFSLLSIEFFDLEICWYVGIKVLFLLNFFSYLNKALSPFFFTSLIILDTDTPLDRILLFLLVIILSNSELKNTLKEALSCLPQKEALVIQLYYVEELNVYEIAEVLDITTGRVSQIKKSAIAKLRDKIKETSF